MPELTAFYQPTTVEQAQALLAEHGERARPLAGGTSLALSKSKKVDVLVDLGRLGLDQIQQQEDGLHVGAMVTCAQLRRQLAGGADALADAVACVGSRVLQNHVTVGGNVVMVYAWSDLPVALLALEASFQVAGSGGARRTLCADELLAAHPTRVLGDQDLLLELVVPFAAAGCGSAHLKLGRNESDQGLASAAVRLELAGGTVRKARVVVGAVRGLPQLLADTSDRLLGVEPTSQSFAAAGADAAREAKVSSDYRASGDYRTALLASLVEDALTLAARRAQGGE